MLLWTGDNEAISFNDDTSLDSRETGIKVYVDAQVLRGASLEWFYRLLALFIDVRGELKSDRAVGKFHELPASTRQSIWSFGLAAVRIHIVDPRPYQQQGENLLREVWRRDDAPDLLGRGLRERVPGMTRVAETLTRYIAGSVINDSTASRAHSLVLSLCGREWFAEWERPRHPPATANLEIVDAFGNKAVLRKATRWAAKSAAAFHSVVDIADDDDEYPVGYDPEMYYRRKIFQRLQATHAFDPDDQQQLTVLRQVREQLLSMVSADERRFCALERGGISTVDSADSFYVQAADFAAAIARTLYSKEGLIGVVSRFEYVTFNGKRVSNTDAEEEMRRILLRQ